jgi:phosphoribosylanthranilate isomerase
VIRVKICGLTRHEDAAIAVDLGADAIGFVFWLKSPRAVTPHAVRSIVDRLPAFVTRVGVFVDASPAEVVETVLAAGLDAVQLHGDEQFEDYRTVGARLIRGVALDDDEAADRAALWPRDVTPLVDAADRERRGGTGQLADWTRAATLAAKRPILLAGGITAENVTDAVRRVRPWAIDVSSGVEKAPGIKSSERMQQLFKAIARVRAEEL